MFCQKCGAKVPEEAEFCLKCGTKLITESKPTEPVSAAPGQQPNGFDEKQSKKKKKLPFILGVIALLIVILAIVGTSGEEVNYAAMVQGHKPFESYDLP
ncbi:zinc-ribbon domain-containing protein [Pseudoflavonifractor phocaeensis]|uniref:zinc-ribbon domain-containing protein n=1 Tax=Pseudoflavonifractor phocaeensis TaxID=1870988 RepID=UPI0019599365|nr:zinc-ribbon domain-containing protein [Pseudoflavonifractor phocaeensis]